MLIFNALILLSLTIIPDPDYNNRFHCRICSSFPRVYRSTRCIVFHRT